MSEFRVGDRVLVHGEIFVIGGFSPMSVVPPVVFLQDAETGEALDVVLLEEVERVKRDADA